MDRDYFCEMVDARAELAGTTTVLEQMVDALKGNSKMYQEVMMNIAERRLKENREFLEKKI
jgi:hypothetical protein